MLLTESEKKKSNVLSNIESTFEIGIVLIAKIEQLTKQKLFPSRKPNLEGKSTGDANEKAFLKNDINFIGHRSYTLNRSGCLRLGIP